MRGAESNTQREEERADIPENASVRVIMQRDSGKGNCLVSCAKSV